MTKVPRKSSRPLLNKDAPLKGGVRRRPDKSQPQLALDPMPARIEPCLAKLVPKPPVGPQWAFEVKWDGYRLAVHVEPSGVRVITRGGHDWTHRFPTIARAAKVLGTTMILDGEAVVLDDQGRPDFGALQNSLGGRGGKRPAGEAIFYAFDLLYYDGHDLTGMELTARRHMLENVIGDSLATIRLSEEVDAEGDVFFAAACEHGLEGIIAKRTDQPYRSGRLGDWVKIKCIQSDAFFIVGYEPSTAALGGIGRLLLAARKGNDLVYVGGVGTGFKMRETMKLRKDLDNLKTPNAPVPIKRKGAIWVQPTLIAEIEYRAWTDDGKLRHASYKGLRDAQDNADVYELEPRS
ncbi:bifunctional non-homologous end joining protein LigD [Rhizobium sp. BK313]|uniref:non-homologous end-joining DNA ligase n=1 Tax=Rhizobium sp. BK313 TaxID=2587081 RepID=UPI00160FC375|nr:non-homologous end-joining DNA ligase [Rhizobium sp. BK313]MBB3453869.1 bifunctional non-homologous end joining protein LigD [Rhizobium sp. BK313]